MDFEVLIVGGGVAGSSAALMLGRCGRTVLVCDDGHPRNAIARGVHGFLTRDGMPPGEFLQIAREQALAYPTVRWRQVHATAVERIARGFRMTLAEGDPVTGATLLLATGLVDELPEVPGAERFWGRSVFVCPFCDAWEVRGQRFLVAGRSEDLFGFAMELRQWSPDLVIATDGADPLNPKQRSLLERLGVPVIRPRIVRLEGAGNQLERVVFVDGAAVETRVMFLTTTQRQRSTLAAQLDCVIDAHGTARVREADCAAAERVWIAGNAATGLQLAVIAAAEGVKAAHAINERLTADALENA